MAWMVLPAMSSRVHESLQADAASAGHHQQHLHASSASPSAQPSAETPAPGHGLHQLALVLYAPRKGTVDVWQMEHGPCIYRLEGISQHARLLTHYLPLQPDAANAFRQHQQRLLDLLQQCWLVDWKTARALDVGTAAIAALQAT